MSGSLAACGSGGGYPAKTAKDGEGNAVCGYRIGIDSWREPEPAAQAEQLLDGANAYLEVAEDPRIVGVDLLPSARVWPKSVR